MILTDTAVRGFVIALVTGILEAKLNPYSRVGTRSPMKLAVRLAGERRARTVYVPPTVDWAPGQQIEVAYAPADPRNFVPLSVARSGGAA